MSVAQALREVTDAVRQAETDFGRAPGCVNLLAVSKTVDVEGIRLALRAGHREFGENYVQESGAKWPALRGEFPDARLHLIGPLQSNKAREAVSLFDAIHTLDRPSLAAALAREIGRTGRSPAFLVQVNTGDEPQKGGVAPSELDPFLAACRTTYSLTVSGLMCIPPAADPPSPHFALLAQLARRNGLSRLSMGMSSDFGAAIQLGSTDVRIGTAIFGARAPKPSAPAVDQDGG